MSMGVSEPVDLRSAGVLNRWTTQLCRLFADHYGPDAGMALVRDGDDWQLVADVDGILEAFEHTTPLTDLWGSLVTGQRDRYGDGVAFAALFALALVERADELAERGLHGNTIQRGGEAAFETTRLRLADAAVESDDSEYLNMLLNGVAAGEGLSAHATVEAVATAVAADDSGLAP